MDEIEKKNKELLEEIEKLKRKVKTLKSRKKYGLVWEEEKEPEQIVLDCQYKIPTLKEVSTKKIITDEKKPMNILIEGDNYHALSVLNYTYKGKIDVIYIDPPYNTGKANEWRYNDKYADENDVYRHSKWLSFMDSRLKLAKNLLKKTGVIFISIDDNEIHNLREIMDEIFREENFIATFIRKSGIAPRLDAKYLATQHDYVVCYSRNIKKVVINRQISEAKGFRYEDEYVTERGRYRLNKLDRGSIRYSESLDYPIVSPDGEKIYPGGDSEDKKWTWRWSKSKVEWGISNGFIVFKKNRENKWSVYYKEYELVDNEGNPRIRTNPYNTFIMEAHNEKGTSEINDLFGEKIFDYPKPLDLMRHLLKIASDKNSLVMDFFAGSGTTGHAVLDINKKDGGNRKFILCTNNENNICTEVCYPRIEKVIKGYKNLKGKQVEGLGGNLRYLKTELLDGDHISHISDEQKIKLTYKAGEMIALRENTFEKVEKNE